MYLGNAEIIVGSLPGGGAYSLAFALQVCAAPKPLVYAPFNWSENAHGIYLFWVSSGVVFGEIRECMNVFVVSISNE